MNNYIEAISEVNLSEQTKIQLGEIIGIENYFYHEINVKNLNKYITIFEYIDNCFNYNKQRNINYFIYYYCWGGQLELQVQALL